MCLPDAYFLSRYRDSAIITYSVIQYKWRINHMDLRKGLSYVAFGFLFTLINFNLTVNGQAISITPNFIGWILFFRLLMNWESTSAEKII